MNVWLRALSEIVQLLLGNPRSQIEYIVLAVLVVLVLLFTMYMVGSATGIANLGNFRRILALSVGIACLMCVWGTVQTYLLPHIETQWLRIAVLIGIPAASGLLVVIPVQQVIFRSGYGATLVTFVASLAVAALFVILANAVVDAVKGGGKESRSIKARAEALEEMLDN